MQPLDEASAWVSLLVLASASALQLAEASVSPSEQESPWERVLGPLSPWARWSPSAVARWSAAASARCRHQSTPLLRLPPLRGSVGDRCQALELVPVCP
ncbi:MAG: hypothetical protein HY261_07080 [Chloroflexi bacterium]|nr:hypothetical protein [Chloroflexota bacterium]